MSAQRILAVVVLLVVGVFTLPVVAYFFDDEGAENWIVPVALLVVAVIGALVGRALPGLAGEGASGARATVVGAVTGVACLVVGLALFFLLLSGFDGA
jgi:hypothetical protein